MHQKKALKDAAKRRGFSAEIVDGIWQGSYRVKRGIVSRQGPLVSIIIPFKDKPKILKQCLDSIFAKSTYKNFEILLMDNCSESPEMHDYLEGLVKEGDPRIRLLKYDKLFNFSAINNFAVKKAKGEYLLLLNNDTEVITPDWIENMLEHAQRKEVGAVWV